MFGWLLLVDGHVGTRGASARASVSIGLLPTCQQARYIIGTRVYRNQGTEMSLVYGCVEIKSLLFKGRYPFVPVCPIPPQPRGNLAHPSCRVETLRLKENPLQRSRPPSTTRYEVIAFLGVSNGETSSRRDVVTNNGRK